MISKTRLPIQALAVLLCATAASAQENRGTPEQRAACAPDAFRLCVSYIPDPASVGIDQGAPKFQAANQACGKYRPPYMPSNAAYNAYARTHG